MYLRIRKGVQPSDAYSHFWYRQVTMCMNRQEQFTPPYGREPSVLLALIHEVWRFRNGRTRAESSSYLKKTSNGSATHNSLVSNKLFVR